MILRGEIPSGFDEDNLPSNEAEAQMIPAPVLATELLEEPVSYDEKYYKKIVNKVERLRSTDGGQVFLWAISRPGACSHFFIENPEALPQAISDLRNGGQITMDHSRRKRNYKENCLSLHIATGAGVSTAMFSEFYGTFTEHSQTGFVLKPEFFTKLADFDDEDLKMAHSQKLSFNESDYTYEIKAVAKSIENGTPLKLAEVNSEIIHPDYGIRNITIVDGNLQEVPITSGDIEFLFSFNRSTLSFGFYSPERNLWLTPQEVSQMAQHCRDDKVWEHYYDTRNYGEKYKPKTNEEIEAMLAEIKKTNPEPNSVPDESPTE